MKILIMSVTAGEGHNSTAKALRACFTENGAECDILDTYGYVSPAIANSINKGYLFVSSKVKGGYRIGYRLAEQRQRLELTNMPLSRLVNMPFAHEIADYIADTKPDAIVFTHPFAGVILDNLKWKENLRIPTVGILTDFVFHPYWEECTRNDYVVIPSPALRFQGYRKGFSDGQLLSYGIPIHPKFAVSTPKEEARRKLGLDPSLPTVLLMGGSMGYGHMAETLSNLDQIDMAQDFQMIVVCGNNAKAKAEIDAMTPRHRLLSYGFVQNVDELMDAASLIVTKPGGLTTSEALAKCLPMIIVNPIPGQEQRNADFLLNSGAAVSTNTVCGVDELVCRILDDPGRLDAMERCIATLRRPNSTRDVCDFVLRLAKEHGAM